MICIIRGFFMLDGGMILLQEQNWKKQTTVFLTAQTMSLFGSALVQYAIIWYITLSTSSGVMMTLSTICGYVPQILVSLFAGVWLDHYDRKRLMILSDAVIAAVTLGIAVLFLMGIRSVWILFAALAVRSAGTGIQTPAVNAFLPQLVPEEKLMRVNGINSTLNSCVIFLAPAVSGLLLSVTSIEATFFVDVVTAALGISLMAMIHPERNRTKTVAELYSMTAGLKEGLFYLKKRKSLYRLFFFVMAVAILISPSAFLIPLLVSRTFGMEIWRLTIAEMTFSLGAVAGGILIAAWEGFRDRRHTVLLAAAFYGLMMIGMGISPYYLLFLCFNGFCGISMPCYNAPLTAYLQETVMTNFQGRIFSLLQIATAAALPLGTVLFGPLADLIPVQTILWINGIIVVLLVFAMFFLKIFPKTLDNDLC